jgi:hypothetical protein
MYNIVINMGYLCAMEACMRITRKSALISTALGMLLMLVLVGCSINGNGFIAGGSSATSNTGTIKISLTDAPMSWSDVQEYHIFIERIEYYSYIDNWVTLVEIGADYDLINYVNGTDVTLAVSEMHAGHYAQLRMVLGTDNWLYIDDGVTAGRFNMRFEQPDHALIKVLDDFEIKKGETCGIILDFDAELSLVTRDTLDLVLRPHIGVVQENIDQKIVFYDDFGTGSDDLDIPNWFEQEHKSHQDKCVVEDGSPRGGRHARMYGKDLGSINHYFALQRNINGHRGGMIRFRARGSDDWTPRDHVYVEFFYNGVWHGAYTFNMFDWTNFDADGLSPFMAAEITLETDMMTADFWVRFRNGMDNGARVFDIDEFELFVQ